MRDLPWSFISHDFFCILARRVSIFVSEYHFSPEPSLSEATSCRAHDSTSWLSEIQWLASL